MLFAYNISIQSLYFIMYISSIFSVKAKKWVLGRKNWFINTKEKLSSLPQNEFLWFHCASLGEFEQARPIIEALKLQKNDLQILVTFFSPSGFEVRKNYEYADVVMYLPLDTLYNAEQFLSLFHIKAAFFIKYEFWYHFISHAAKQNIPLYLISATFRSNQPFFKPYGSFYRGILKKFRFIFVQNESDKVLLETIGIDAVVSGDTRYDRVIATAAQPMDLPLIKRFKGTSKLLVAGSVWREDIDVLNLVINDLYLNTLALGKIKAVIAPHEISENHLKYIENKIKRPCLRYSEAGRKDLSLYDVLLIDNVGMLSSIYRYGNYAYIGGAFGKGLHNILEAAVFGMPVFFGNKKLHKYPEAIELMANNGAVSVINSKDFEEKFYRLAADGASHELMSKNASEFVKHKAGATRKILEYITGV